jgi:pimeloyl-ACP methyl ester carboxylesterase/DNA-binding CsgD family transcriptional regulator
MKSNMKPIKSPKNSNYQNSSHTRLSNNDLEEYDAFMSSFRELISRFGDTNAISGYEVTELGHFSENAIKSFLKNDPLQYEIKTLNNTATEAEFCSIITDRFGTVIEANLVATELYKIVLGNTLEDNFIEIFGGSSFQRKFSEIEIENKSTSGFNILQASVNRSQILSTLAVKLITHKNSKEPFFLIVFLTPPNMAAAVNLISSKFRLSEAETYITASLIDGMTLREIAVKRSRSYKTIRNQLQQVLEKTNSNSQKTLMKLVSDLTFLLLEERRLLENIPHKNSKTIEIPRPQGRKVEVLLCGDEFGIPIVSLPALFGHGITDELVQSFILNKVFYVSVSRPGYGTTSKPPKGQSLDDCTARDMIAVLEALEISKCIIMGRAASSQSVYNMLLRIPDRFLAAIILGGMVPRKYFLDKTIKSKWTEAVMAVSTFSKPISRLLLATGHRLFLSSNPITFLDRMYADSKTDCAAFRQGDTAEVIRQSCVNATYQGIDAGVQDMVDGFKDWDNSVETITVPVKLLHGLDDGNIPIDAVREFAARHKKQFSLQEFSPGGGQLLYSHTDEILEIINKLLTELNR